LVAVVEFLRRGEQGEAGHAVVDLGADHACVHPLAGGVLGDEGLGEGVEALTGLGGCDGGGLGDGGVGGGAFDRVVESGAEIEIRLGLWGGGDDVCVVGGGGVGGEEDFGRLAGFVGRLPAGGGLELDNVEGCIRGGVGGSGGGE